MSVAAVSRPIYKEVRALALPWLACLACMVVPAAIDAPRFLGGIAMPAFFFGTAALGALSIGHEYTGRTLSLLLSLPARRERLLAVKLSVLAATLLTLWFVASSFVFGTAPAPRRGAAGGSPSTSPLRPVPRTVVDDGVPKPDRGYGLHSGDSGRLIGHRRPDRSSEVRIRIRNAGVQIGVRVVRHAGLLRHWRRHELVVVHAARGDRRTRRGHAPAALVEISEQRGHRSITGDET